MGLAQEALQTREALRPGKDLLTRTVKIINGLPRSRGFLGLGRAHPYGFRSTLEDSRKQSLPVEVRNVYDIQIDLGELPTIRVKASGEVRMDARMEGRREISPSRECRPDEILELRKIIDGLATGRKNLTPLYPNSS